MIQQITFGVNGTVTQVVEFYDDQYTVEDIRKGDVLTTLGPDQKLRSLKDLRVVGRIVSQDIGSDTEYDFSVRQEPGWVFYDEDGNEIGHALAGEYQNAEQAMEAFARESPEHTIIMFRDSMGEVHACAPESTPDDFD